MEISIKKEADGYLIFYGEKLAARACAYPGAADELEILQDGILRWKRMVEEPVRAMQMEVISLFEPVHTMIPSVLYDGNPWGSDHEYKGYTWNGEPYVISGQRAAVPGATSSTGREFSLACWSEAGCSQSLEPKADCAVHRICWPVQEGPRMLASDGWGDAYQEEMEPQSEFTVWISIGTADDVPAWQKMLRKAWEDSWHPLERRIASKTLWDWSVSYAKQLYTEEPDGFRAFSIGYHWYEDHWEKRRDLKYEIGWCGQNASLAVSLLYDYQMNNAQDSLEIALNVLDAWVDQARSKEGYLLTRYDPQDSLIDACNLGTYGLQLFEASDQLERIGQREKAEKYRKAALEICDFALERQRLDGGIGFTWNRDGSVQELRGTAGAFLILPLAAAFARTKEERYNIAAVRAYSYYYREYHAHGYGTSGALDTCCIDKESVIPLLKGGLMMFETTGFRRYLEMAEEAAYYLSTWQWHQTNEVRPGSELDRIQYDTYGGTAVSTSHHHMDAFALSYVEDLWKLGEYTQKEAWKQRAIAAWCNGIQGISDGTLELKGNDARWKGASDEGFMHTRWGNLESKKSWAKSYDTTQWLVAWPCAFRLEILRNWKDWTVLDHWNEQA